MTVNISLSFWTTYVFMQISILNMTIINQNTNYLWNTIKMLYAVQYQILQGLLLCKNNHIHCISMHIGIRFKWFLLLFLCILVICQHVCLCESVRLVICLHVCLYKGVRYSGTRVLDSSELPCGYWELSPSPTEEQPVLLPLSHLSRPLHSC